MYKPTQVTDDNLILTLPMAFPDDRVMVHNYKAGAKDKPFIWEIGTVMEVSVKLLKVRDFAIESHYSYTVKLDRKSKNNQLPLLLYVDCSGIKPM